MNKSCADAPASLPIALYARDIAPVWRECFRVLRSFYNPVVFVGDRDPR